MGEYTIRELEDGDAPSLLSTFNRVFGAANAAFVPRTREQWTWAFEKNPAGRRVFVAVHAHEVVAQFAGLPVAVLIDGREQFFTQIVDSMVHPEHRAGLKRPGLFVNTAQAFVDHFTGPEKDLVLYGWPVEEAFRIGERFLGYEVLRRELVLAREVGDGSRELPPRVGHVERIARFDHQARWLYERCCGAFAASAIRDDRFLNWRFVDHPSGAYRCFGARDEAGILRGLAVYRFGRFGLPSMGVIVDWLVPPEEVEIGELLMQALLAAACSDAAQAVCGMIPDWSPWFERFQEWGFAVHPSDHTLVGRTFHPRLDDSFLREGWWYQLADSDLM